MNRHVPPVDFELTLGNGIELTSRLDSIFYFPGLQVNDISLLPKCTLPSFKLGTQYFLKYR